MNLTTSEHTQELQTPQVHQDLYKGKAVKHLSILSSSVALLYLLQLKHTRMTDR